MTRVVFGIPLRRIVSVVFPLSESEPPEEPSCPIDPITNFVDDIPCWAQTAVDWVIENELFSILDEEDVRDAVKFYRFFLLLQEG